MSRQPRAGIPIDWLNPLTNGLIFAAPDSQGNEVITVKQPKTIRSGNTLEPVNLGKFGFGMASMGSSANAARFYDSAYVQSKLNSSNELTMWSVQRIDSAGDAWETPFGIDVYSSAPWFIGYSQTGTPHQFVASIKYTDDTYSRPTFDNVWPDAGWPVIFSTAMTFDRSDTSARIKIYRDGVQRGTDAGQDKAIGVPYNISYNTVGLNDWDQQTSQDNFDGPILLALIWNRALSAAEIAKLERNPWQIFQPRNLFMPLAEYTPIIVEAPPVGALSITDVANSGETPGSGTETWNDGSTGNVITGVNFL